MRNSKKAFTLVELIVVITILAILGTIAFISLQGYSSDARNTKRTSDLGNIVSKMSTEAATGRPLMSFVWTSQTNSILTTVALGWSWAEAKAISIYNVGNPNYTSLWVKEEDFKDPTDKHYLIAVTSLVGGRYEVAASLEDGAGSFEAKVEWTYAPRANNVFGTDNTKSVDTSNNLVVVADTAAGFFRKGDTITDDAGVNTTIISKVASDGLTLTVWTWGIFDASSVINLSNSEISGLIGSTTTPLKGTPVIDWGTDLPY